MSSKSSGTKPKTRQGSGTKLSEFVGRGKEFVGSEVPTYRAVIQKAILLQEIRDIEEDIDRQHYQVKYIARDLAPLVLAQWEKSNVKFSPPVIISEVPRKIEWFWLKVSDVVRNKAKKSVKDYVETHLDKLFDITTCPHTILLCKDQESSCPDPQVCKVKAHVKCDCPLASKVPILELEWLYYQRNKSGEQSAMMIAGVDEKETKRQVKAEKRKEAEYETKVKKQKKQEGEESRLRELQLEENTFDHEIRSDQSLEEEDMFTPPPSVLQQEKKEVVRLVDWMLKEKLGNLAHLVVQYLDRPGLKRNTMPVHKLAMASLRFDISPAAAAACATGFLQDLIAAGHVSSDMAYAACDPNKVRRARQEAMTMARTIDKEKSQGTNIIGLGYDGRKDPRTRAMVPDS